MTLMRRASGQRRGSVVIMPSTSVQISMRSAFKPAPKMAAEKSDPPRPMVVVTPARLEPMNPPITGTLPPSDRKSTRLNSSHLVNSYAVFCLKKKTQPPRSLGAAINENLETVILSCIAKDPSKRPQRASVVFFFNDTATTEIYTLSLHDALPISLPP